MRDFLMITLNLHRLSISALLSDGTTLCAAIWYFRAFFTFFTRTDNKDLWICLLRHSMSHLLDTSRDEIHLFLEHLLTPFHHILRAANVIIYSLSFLKIRQQPEECDLTSFLLRSSFAGIRRVETRKRLHKKCRVECWRRVWFVQKKIRNFMWTGNAIYILLAFRKKKMGRRKEFLWALKSAW